MEEISVQIPEFVDREKNIRRKCSTILRGNKILPSSFWPYFRRYREDNFVDRVMNARKKFLFKFQNLSIEKQTFAKSVPRFCMENKIFPIHFWPFFRRYRDDNFVDRAKKRRK